jgi:hypothetical protein
MSALAMSPFDNEDVFTLVAQQLLPVSMRRRRSKSAAKADTCTDELAFRAVSVAARNAFDERVNLLAKHERGNKHLKKSSTTWSKSSMWSSKSSELRLASWKLKNSMPFRSERNRSAACKFLKNCRL